MKKNIGILLLVFILVFSSIGISFAEEDLYSVGGIAWTHNTEKDWSKVFFENPDYSNPEEFLKNGDVTKVTPYIEEIAKQFNDKKDFSTLREIYEWIHSNTKSYSDHGTVPDTVEAEDIIKTGKNTGCIQISVMFATLARAKGIPTVIVQTSTTSEAEDIMEGIREDGTNGHAFAEVYINDKWYLVDPTGGDLYFDYNKENFNIDEEHYVFAKGLDMPTLDIINIGGAPYMGFKRYNHKVNVQATEYKVIPLDMNEDFKRRSDKLVTPHKEALLLGSAEACKAFGETYTYNTSASGRGNFPRDLSPYDYIVTMIDNRYDYTNEIKKFFDNIAIKEINNNQKVRLHKVIRDTRLIVIKEPTGEKLVETILSLPDEFFTKESLEVGELKNKFTGKTHSSIKINDKFLDLSTSPTVVEGRNLVPVRDIFEALGLTVDWNGETRTAVGYNSDIKIEFPIDKNFAYKNGEKFDIDVAAQIINGNTMVPVRFIAESLDCDVIWSDETKTTLIYTKDFPH